MTDPFFFFLVIIILLSYYRRRESASGRRNIRYVTHYGAVFCVLGLNLWIVTRFEDILSSFPGPRHASIFATPWLWILALCVGIALLTASFLTRKSQ